ncbi:MAG TPA: AAA family ATPase [Phycisphaerales bacterium]|nr:AAA family ATPase [Phycisphaerales bacterium]
MNTDLITTPIRLGHTCLRVVTWEEAEARQAAFGAAGELGLELWTWSATSGLVRGPLSGNPIKDTANPGAALVFLRTNLVSSSLVVMLDLADHLGDPHVLRALREFAEQLRAGTPHGSAILMIDYKDEVPGVVERMSHTVTPPLPTDEQIEGLVRRCVRNINVGTPLRVSLSKGELGAMVQHLRGLDRRHVEELIRGVVLDDKALNADDLARLVRAKRERIGSRGVLEFVDAPAALDEIGGLDRLKTWLKRRELSFTKEAKEFGIAPPRGVLLLGVQGAGKSLAAKAIATAWKRPLLRLDPGTLYDRYIGESEKRLRDALAQAEAMSPAVLWIDEIEKGFASAASRSTDGGLSQRMFGTLLTWMQEHTSPLFLVATANDIEALPPELLRKGRFDEIFFVDLPGDDARRRIFEVHLARRKVKADGLDLAALVNASMGYSGSEIEQAVIAALHEAFSSGGTMTTESLMKCIRESPPLSVTMGERIAALRAWSQGRCVPAD